LGRKLAARVLKTWIEDFVDEDTGEVVSIERNEVIIDRDTILEKEHIEEIVDAEVKTILLTQRRCAKLRIRHHLQYTSKRPNQLGKRSG
jgi:DNA-directed RNA polymerase subunit beta